MITTLYTVTVPIYQALKARDYSTAEYKRRVALAFIGDVFGWWGRTKIKHMYIFKADYNDSVDLARVEKDFAKIKDRWDPQKLFSTEEQPTISRRTYADECDQFVKKDNDVYLYDVSSFV